MSVLTAFTATLLITQAAHSYILLTANLEDVQTLAKQLAESPVVNHLSRIWRRAANQFSDHVSSDQIKRKRADADDMPDEPMWDPSPNNDPSQKSTYLTDESNNYPRHRRKQDNDDIIALGKNASVYLKSIQEIFEKKFAQ